MNYETEQEAREYLRQLKNYYTNLAIRGIILTLCFIIWLFTGGPLWPLWILLAFGISAFLEGVRLGVFPMLPDLFPFLKKDWEETQLRKIRDEKKSGSKKTSGKPPSEGNDGI